MIKLFRKIRRCWFIVISMFDKEFIADVLSIHHPSELKAWKTFNDFIRQEENKYKYERYELSNWRHLGLKYGCRNICEMEELINDLVDKLNKAENKSVPHNIDKWFKMKKFLQK